MSAPNRAKLDDHKRRIGLAKKRDRQIAIVVRTMIREQAEGRAKASCFDEIAKAAGGARD